MAHTIIGEARQGTASIRQSGNRPLMDETYIFRVKADSKTASRISVLSTAGLPIVGVSTSAYGYTVCQSKDASRDENNPWYWDVTCQFSSEVQEGDGGGSEPQAAGQNPEAWVPIYETKFEKYTEYALKDLDNKQIANSVGQVFEGGLPITRNLTVWEFYQLEPATVTDVQMAGRNDVINSDTFKSQAPFTLRLTILSSVIGYYYGTLRRLTQYRIVVNPSGWRYKCLDVGTRYKDGAIYKPYLDINGDVIKGNLNGSGAKVAAGADAAELTFKLVPEIAFNGFLR